MTWLLKHPWLILQSVIQIIVLRLVDVFMFSKEATKMAKQVENSHNTSFLPTQYQIVFVGAKLDSTLRTWLQFLWIEIMNLPLSWALLSAILQFFFSCLQGSLTFHDKNAFDPFSFLFLTSNYKIYKTLTKYE